MGKRITVGVDMGDKNHSVCVLDATGEVLSRDHVTNTSAAIQKYFKDYDPCLIALEAGTHSAWVSRILEKMGHEVLVGNPRKLRAIWDSDEKCDDRDAELLARIARLDPKLMHPIRHRSEDAQIDLGIIKARDILVKTRTTLIAHVRASVKSVGKRISKCNTECFHVRAAEDMPPELAQVLEPVIKSIEDLTMRIRHYENLIEKISTDKYSETEVLRAIRGVGPVTALAFVLTIEDPSRFKNSRNVGPFLGLTRKRDQSGETDKQLPITKAGNAHLRRLLVGCAHYILGPFGGDCELRRFGLKLAKRGGKNAKKRAVVAVARKLAVLMHCLWVTQGVYDPFHLDSQKVQKVA